MYQKSKYLTCANHSRLMYRKKVIKLIWIMARRDRRNRIKCVHDVF